jgi:hypothetical protein
MTKDTRPTTAAPVTQRARRTRTAEAPSTPLRITPDQLHSAAPEVYQSYQALIQQNGGGKQNITINVEACPQSPSEGGAMPTAGTLTGRATGQGMSYSDLVFYDLFEPEIGALYRKAWKREVTHQLGLDRAATGTPATQMSGGHAGTRSPTAQATRFGSEHRALPHYPQPTLARTAHIHRRRCTKPWLTLLIGLLVILLGFSGSALIAVALSL